MGNNCPYAQWMEKWSPRPSEKERERERELQFREILNIQPPPDMITFTVERLHV